MGEKKCYIFQFRNSPLEEQEQQAFCRYAPGGSVVFVNVLRGEEKRKFSWENAGGIIFAGAGDYSVTSSPSWLPRLQEIAREAVARDVPFLGVCLGHQILALAFGAEVQSLREQSELGTVRIRINSEGLASKLFAGMPEEIAVMAGHNDSVVAVPPGIKVLAGNARCPIQAMQIVGKCAYGVQFHPELTEKDFQARLEYYRDYYIEKSVDIDALVRERALPTNDELVLKNFFSLCSYS